MGQLIKMQNNHLEKSTSTTPSPYFTPAEDINVIVPAPRLIFLTEFQWSFLKKNLLRIGGKRVNYYQIFFEVLLGAFISAFIAGFLLNGDADGYWTIRNMIYWFFVSLIGVIDLLLFLFTRDLSQKETVSVTDFEEYIKQIEVFNGRDRL